MASLLKLSLLARRLAPLTTWTRLVTTTTATATPSTASTATSHATKDAKKELLAKFGNLTPQPISIAELLRGDRATFAYLSSEIPIRLANMVLELELLPEQLLRQENCAAILKDYVTSFGEVVAFEALEEPVTAEQLQSFCDTLVSLRRRHLDTVPHMAEAVVRMNQEGVTAGVASSVAYFLDRLYANRISIHMLMSQFMAMQGQDRAVTGLVGVLDPQCNIEEVAREAYATAALLCDQEFMDHPHLVVTNQDVTDPAAPWDTAVTAAYVPAHLHHIFFEVFKNSMRASCELAEARGLLEVPPVRVGIYRSADDITVKISDRGGGMPRRVQRRIFDYSYTTAADAEIPDTEPAGLQGDAVPMHGLGYGLPLSSLYARYFNGDLRVASVHGMGTDTFVYLSNLSSKAEEGLPVFGDVSRRRLTSTAKVAQDWTDMSGHSYD